MSILLRNNVMYHTQDVGALAPICENICIELSPIHVLHKHICTSAFVCLPIEFVCLSVCKMHFLYACMFIYLFAQNREELLSELYE